MIESLNWLGLILVEYLKEMVGLENKKNHYSKQ